VNALRWPPRVLAACGLAVGAAGGLGAAALAGTAGRAAPVTHTVTIDASSYRPARLAVHVGDTVVWVNEDVIPHTATAAGRRFDSQTIAAGASWRLTIEARGATDYTCLFHPTMTGRIEAD
jgi:plastocyanin